MLFNSVQFAAFFVIVYFLYLSSGHRRQNTLLLIASYIFYGAWDWRFLSLLFISTSIDYLCGIKIYESEDSKNKRLFLLISIVSNLAILGFFKYFNFFASSLQSLLGYFGINVNTHFINIILPVGISFYTFQAMSYCIDIYRGQLKPTKNLFDFALFVAYFPQLVAGPIERASHLLPQILNKRKVTLEGFYEGAYLIFWGLFQKVFVADNLAKIVDPLFASPAPYNGIRVLLGAYAFAFQIFCDFAGYSNIARGLGKCMGFDIMLNFNLPYFSTNPVEFWKRWHISLSTWLKDYLYIPLGGNRDGNFLTYRNIFITMLLGGLWHGAAWTFIVWGAYHAVLIIVYKLADPFLKTIPEPKNIFIRRAWFSVRLIFFFHLICAGWLLFRANSLTQTSSMLYSVVNNLNEGWKYFRTGLSLAFYTWVVVVIQLFQFKKNDLMAVYKTSRSVRALFYVICFYLLIIFGVSGAKEFIYFQF